MEWLTRSNFIGLFNGTYTAPQYPLHILEVDDYIAPGNGSGEYFFSSAGGYGPFYNPNYTNLTNNFIFNNIISQTQFIDSIDDVVEVNRLKTRYLYLNGCYYSPERMAGLTLAEQRRYSNLFIIDSNDKVICPLMDFEIAGTFGGSFPLSYYPSTYYRLNYFNNLFLNYRTDYAFPSGTAIIGGPTLSKEFCYKFWKKNLGLDSEIEGTYSLINFDFFGNPTYYNLDTVTDVGILGSQFSIKLESNALPNGSPGGLALNGRQIGKSKNISVFTGLDGFYL